ncbi:PBP1A family penicillin-binding protein, partial [Candidatus Uhrbacteria bacterium]|nr:PBP1A family penicillin-binding protein [Candidatus Uhrbacteria bacterium]MBD3284574.1 PBP1A family penicillin-binding protein [Candidatus Uhrbacteria bacterium]
MPIKHLHDPKTSNHSKHHSGKKPHRWKSILITLGVLVGGLVLLGFFVLTLTLAWMSRDLPNPNALLDREIAQSTKIFDRSGEVLLYEIHGDEQRTLVAIEDIPDVMKHATVAIEDKDFYKHHGVSWKGLIRAFYTSVIKRQRVQGTSTLTQQFVKNAILTNERSINRKLKELLLSLQIERKYSKDQILQLYLNEIPYGSTLYGVESATQGYFGKSVRDISLDEAALLAAMPQAPDLYNPYGIGSRGDNRDLLTGRQHYILDQMAEQGYVSAEEAEAAKEIDTLEKLIPRTVGNIKAPHFVMYVRSQLIEALGQRTVETGGLKVITTLDWRLQQAAEEAVVEGVEARAEQYGFSNASLVAIGPQDGHILAMVGSKDFFDDENDGQVNVSIRPRQPGSSFKPIVYTAGFMKGFLPETTLWDVKTQFKTDSKNYSPNNYDFSERGPVSIRMALQGSLNIPAVKMLYLVGVGRVLDFAEELGYTTLGERSRFGLSLVLGGGEVKLLEHAAAYGVFANKGVKHPTTAILKVEDNHGNVMQEWELGDGTRVLDEQSSKLISNVLSDNNARAFVFGTNSHLALPGRAVAAKTGTTNDYRDAWTLGYTPSLVAGVWAGNNDNTEMKRGAGGSAIAAPIWNAFMSEALTGSPAESFDAPTPSNTTKDVLRGKAFETKVKIDTISGKLATEYTPEEFVEEKTFYDAHSILYYVDRDNPLGPIPSNPARDPQFGNWEAAVQDWVTREEWNATGTPPTEYDDVHTEENTPEVRIREPNNRDKINSRSFPVEVRVSAPRNIQSVKAVINGYVIGSAFSNSGNTWNINATIPNALGKGFHDLRIEARDDVGNLGSSKITINLLADPEELRLQVVNPGPGSEISMDDFPKSVEIQINDLSDIQRADLYLQTPTGETKLIGSNIVPTENPVRFNWSFLRGSGVYSLYAEATTRDGETIIGDTISITVT